MPCMQTSKIVLLFFSLTVLVCGGATAQNRVQVPIRVVAQTAGPELSVDFVVEQVLARNPTLAQMSAAWQAATARYPQVTSLEDPTFSGTVAPASIGSNDVSFGYRLEVSQKLQFHGKLR